MLHWNKPFHRGKVKESFGETDCIFCQVTARFDNLRVASNAIEMNLEKICLVDYVKSSIQFIRNDRSAVFLLSCSE